MKPGVDENRGEGRVVPEECRKGDTGMMPGESGRRPDGGCRSVTQDLQMYSGLWSTADSPKNSTKKLLELDEESNRTFLFPGVLILLRMKHHRLSV